MRLWQGDAGTETFDAFTASVTIREAREVNNVPFPPSYASLTMREAREVPAVPALAVKP